MIDESNTRIRMKENKCLNETKQIQSQQNAKHNNTTLKQRKWSTTITEQNMQTVPQHELG